VAIRNPERKVLVLWLIALAMITYKEVRGGASKMPAPSAYLPSSIIYGIAAVLAEVAGDVSVLLATGWTISLAIGMTGGGRVDREGGGGAGRAAPTDGAPVEVLPPGSTHPKGGGPNRQPRRRRNPTLRKRRRLGSAQRRR
jgi:hypothetical protein